MRGHLGTCVMSNSRMYPWLFERWDCGRPGGGRRRRDAPPSRFQEGGPLPPPVAVDRHRPAAGLSREVAGSERDNGNPVRRRTTAMRLLDCKVG
jgi:hypothetical protein